jgi:glutaredoxin 2
MNIETSLTGSNLHLLDSPKYPFTPRDLRTTISIFSIPKSTKAISKCRKCKEYESLKKKYATLLEETGDVKLHSDHGSSKPLNSFRITDDTSSFLRSVSNNFLATSLINCRDSNQDLNFDTLSPEEIQTYTNNLADLIGECFDKLLSTKDYAERINNQTRIYNLLEAVKNTRFGEDAFKPILGKIKPLLKKFATVIVIDGTPEADQDFDLNITISEAYKALAIFKLCNSQPDTEQKMMYGFRCGLQI